MTAKAVYLVPLGAILICATQVKADGQPMIFTIARQAEWVTMSNGLPEMPEPKVIKATPAVSREGAPAHERFYSGRATKITLGVELGAWAADMALTCRNLANSGREWALPASTCGQAVALTAGFHATGEGVAYLLHRLGHHKLEQVPRWYLAFGNIYGTAYSSAHIYDPRIATPVD